MKMGLRHGWESSVSDGGLRHLLRTDLFEAMTQTSTILGLEPSALLLQTGKTAAVVDRWKVVDVQEKDA